MTSQTTEFRNPGSDIPGYCTMQLSLKISTGEYKFLVTRCSCNPFTLSKRKHFYFLKTLSRKEFIYWIRCLQSYWKDCRTLVWASGNDSQDMAEPVMPGSMLSLQWAGTWEGASRQPSTAPTPLYQSVLHYFYHSYWFQYPCKWAFHTPGLSVPWSTLLVHSCLLNACILPSVFSNL